MAASKVVIARDGIVILGLEKDAYIQHRRKAVVMMIGSIVGKEPSFSIKDEGIRIGMMKQPEAETRGQANYRMHIAEQRVRTALNQGMLPAFATLHLLRCGVRGRPGFPVRPI